MMMMMMIFNTNMIIDLISRMLMRHTLEKKLPKITPLEKR